MCPRYDPVTDMDLFAQVKSGELKDPYAPNPEELQP